MACAALEEPKKASVSTRPQWLSSLCRRLAWRLARPDRLDLEGMPDRVKRDLGFLDGRDPFYEAEPRR
ncbi:hypothetical protein [Rhizobium sp. 18055]|jgi:hypothetical protein|uniref:hypothetical protein n=1 Tax=Rhizobium sp. 18055 TaxID=2681403 RepID=UPI001358206D|nr:hypothetical protein [Rhizobium sp. 18055]